MISFINPLAELKIKEYFKSVYPHEGCGIILKDDTFVPCPNVSDDPMNHFELPTELYLKYENEAKAIVHSHPDGEDSPSKLDMQSQLNADIPFGLCVVRPQWAGRVWFWGDGIPEVPLIKRPFRHGATGTDGKGDCFALIRDYFKQELNVTLKEYPRSDNWWKLGETLYDSYFKDAGFHEIPKNDYREHDVFLMAINSKTPNHAGIYTGNNLILHHLSNRVSRHEPIGRWPKMLVKWVRHNSLE